MNKVDKATTGLAALITTASLASLAGSRSYERGETYFAAGAVRRMRVEKDRVSATVEGTESYRVELRDEDGELSADCTCPHAGDGFFCKHCVAVGLAWLDEHPAAAPTEHRAGKKATQARRRDPWKEIQNYLGAQAAETLIALLLEAAQRDDGLYQSLLLKAERALGGDNAERAFRRAIDDAVRVRGFVDWHEVGTYADNIERVVDALDDLLQPDSAAMLVGLAEHAIEKIENALEQVDDSSGNLGSIVHRLGELHFKACTMAKSDPVALAERLFKLETTLPFGLCDLDHVTYRTPLGKKGLQRYRALAQAEWQKIGPRSEGRGFDVHRSTITRIMERLAEADGNVDELVAIKAKDLSSSYRYLAIAETLAAAKRHDEALGWAERGLQAFPDRPGDVLRDFLVAAYLKRKRNDEALQLTWVQFEERPGLEPYKKLHGVAGKLGVWPAQRERALDWLDQSIAKAAASTSRWKPKPSTPDYSLRVSIALWEQDLDVAWTAAHHGVCDRGLLIKLADKLEQDRPDDAIRLYRRVIPGTVEQTKNSAYEDAARWVRRIGILLKAMHRSSEFGDYLAELRVQFKPKRNFMRLLDDIARTAGSERRD